MKNKESCKRQSCISIQHLQDETIDENINTYNPAIKQSDSQQSSIIQDSQAVQVQIKKKHKQNKRKDNLIKQEQKKSLNKSELLTQNYSDHSNRKIVKISYFVQKQLKQIQIKLQDDGTDEVLHDEEIINQSLNHYKQETKEKFILAAKLIDFIVAPMPQSKINIDNILDDQQITILNKTPSFSDKIMDIINNHQCQEQYKQVFRDLFENGVQLEVYQDQKRFIQARNTEKKLCFNPTITVTKSLFFQIRMMNSIKVLQQFNGIGKSISFILYKRLSQQIYRYLRQVNYHKTIQTKFNLYLYPRLIYISLHRNSTQHSLIQSILKQCQIDIEQNQLKKITVKNDFSCTDITLKQLYQQKFGNHCKLALIVDQLGILCQSFRNYSFYHQFYSKRSKQNRNKFQQKSVSQIKKISQIEVQQKFEISYDKIEKQNQNAQAIKQFLQNLIPHFYSIYYISNLSIDQQMLQKLDLQNDYHEQQLTVQQPIHYQLKAQNPQTMLQIIDFYLFQVKQKIKGLYFFSSKDKLIDCFIKNKQHIRNSIIKDINNLKIFLLTPLNIRRSLNKQNFHSIKIPSKLIKQIISKFHLLQNQAYESLKASVNKFIHKFDASTVKKHKLSLSIKLFYQLKSILKTNKQKAIEWNGSFTFSGICKKQIQYIDKNLFSVTAISQNRVQLQCLVPVTAICNIFDYALTDEDFMFLSNKQILDLMNRSSLGCLIQSIIIKILNYKHSQWKYNQSYYFNYGSNGSFEALNNKNVKQSFIDKFKYFMQAKTNVQSILLLPAKKNQAKQLELNIQDRSSNCKAIDFIIGYKFKSKIIFHAFDVTTSPAKSNIKQKFANFIDSYFNFIDRKDNGMVQLKYYLLIPVVCINDDDPLKKMITIQELEQISDKFIYSQKSIHCFTIKNIENKQEILIQMGIIKFNTQDIDNKENDMIKKYQRLIEDCRNCFL